MKERIFKISIFALMPLLLQSQSVVELGLFAGAANYQGDLAENQIQIGETNPAASGFLRYHLHPNFSLRGNLAFVQLTGDDNNNPELRDRRFRFENRLVELGLMGEVYFVKRPGVEGFESFKANASPYLLLGIGLAFGDPKPECYSAACRNGTTPNPFPERGERSTFLAIPLGVGVRFEPLEFISIGFEFVYRSTFSDYLDGISKSANPNKNDWYFVTGLNAAYIFGN